MWLSFAKNYMCGSIVIMVTRQYAIQVVMIEYDFTLFGSRYWILNTNGTHLQNIFAEALVFLKELFCVLNQTQCIWFLRLRIKLGWGSDDTSPTVMSYDIICIPLITIIHYIFFRSIVTNPTHWLIWASLKLFISSFDNGVFHSRSNCRY